MSTHTNPGEVHHLEVLAQLEKHFHGALNPDKFYEDLIKFIEKNFPGARDQGLSWTELQKIDEFTRQYFEATLPEVERWIARGYVIGMLVDKQERTPAIRTALDINALPSDIKATAKEYRLGAREVKMLEWTKSGAANHLINASNDTANRVRNVLMDNINRRQTNRELHHALEREFFEDEGESNRNWKRVAIYEVNAAFNNGYLAQRKAGDWVVGLSLPDRCDVCGKLIDGRVYQVTKPIGSMEYADLAKNSAEYKRRAWLWEHTVWIGKDNYGRSRATKKQVDKGTGNKVSNLIDREHYEKIMPSIPLHPICRCRYVSINIGTQYVSSEGEIKVRAMDEKAWKKWHEQEIGPILAEMKELGIQ